jgi:hypothetical protein
VASVVKVGRAAIAVEEQLKPAAPLVSSLFPKLQRSLDSE